ncbi:MAG TPA: flagellar assembly protein FliW [Verrucomicrobiae bacterium]|nr:flagellar assembly protein FliW [Verrucomicrobiae bacterium]
MTSANAIEIEESEITESAGCTEVRIPAGLLGFEQMKDYLLITRPGEAPFCWLQVKDNPSLAFVVIEPFHFLPDYQPDIPQADVDLLGLSGPEDAAVYVIVTVTGSRRATANLKGPVVINRHSGVAKQVVIANAAKYSVHHPLPVGNAA